jgi:uncharacterized protein (DUF2249 family)/hemerythrin-like domain-containing protein
MPYTVQQVDLRVLQPSERDSRILGTFESLAEGDAFVLIDDRDARRVLEALEARFPGAVEWSSLEAGPARFRTEIRRRAPGSARTVSDYLGFDHRRLDSILPEVEKLVAEVDLAAAAERFAEFSCGLDRHIEAEEEILFPDFERRTGMTSGPTVVMRAEHVEIRRWMGAASSCLEAHDLEGFRNAVARMTDVLAEHNLKEEHILYPMSDDAVGDPRAQHELVRKMQGML